MYGAPITNELYGRLPDDISWYVDNIGSERSAANPIGLPQLPPYQEQSSPVSDLTEYIQRRVDPVTRRIPQNLFIDSFNRMIVSSMRSSRQHVDAPKSESNPVDPLHQEAVQQLPSPPKSDFTQYIQRRVDPVTRRISQNLFMESFNRMILTSVGNSSEGVDAPVAATDSSAVNFRIEKSAANPVHSPQLPPHQEAVQQQPSSAVSDFTEYIQRRIDPATHQIQKNLFMESFNRMMAGGMKSSRQPVDAIRLPAEINNMDLLMINSHCSRILAEWNPLRYDLENHCTELVRLVRERLQDG
ncbi:hypothetical protein QR680_006683 [Steinernema hermaphroditum]|uniref:Uncharacterized protein n=1 Tax=Steinernema hermaphroditum TaxID=289476 RepID=A0AA39HXP4_9BILA|nr:hypothetical protein QR680_006683 [Steinernema hermaphroditum]